MTRDGKTDISIISEKFLGSVLIGGNGAPDSEGNLQPDGAVNYMDATMSNWQKLMYRIGNTTVQVGKYHIGVLSGTDAVHNNQHVLGVPLFPHNINLAATHNPEHFKNMGYWTA